jgi:hypothetical protein
MYFFARLRIDLQISIFGFSHELLVFSIFHRENVKSESSTPLIEPQIESSKSPDADCEVKKPMYLSLFLYIL